MTTPDVLDSYFESFQSIRKVHISCPVLAGDAPILQIHSYHTSPKLPEIIPNTRKEIAKLITKLKKIDQPKVIFEATGGYEKLLLGMLQDVEIHASRIPHHGISRSRLREI